MRYALSWLNDYVNLKSDPNVLAERLVMTTAEVEEIIAAPAPIKTGVIAEVLSVEPHPNADRLRLVTVRSRRGTDTIVCGAPNVAVGQMVPFLPAGSTYVGDGGSFCTLETATIRGVKSAGMLASEHDLGLSDDHSGIVTLPPETSINTTLAAAFSLDRPVLDLEITPNRGDLLSYWGLAREVAFLEKTRLKEPALLSIKDNGDKDHTPHVVISDAGCVRYTALVIENLTNGPAPSYIQHRLRLSGVEPINAIVDITNYVMLELGQPLHAFDYDKLAEHQQRPDITVRKAVKGERLGCLDHVERHLTRDDLVIANSDGPVALAGVIGGKETAVQSNSTTIMLESASFKPGDIRKMARRHGLRTESANRFEKQVDLELPVKALKRASYLLKEICGGEPAGGVIDSGQAPARHRRLAVDLERAGRILGLPVTKAAARQLGQIGFEVTDKKSTIVEISVPSWRDDIVIEEDIYEEIIRLIGYDQLPATLPNGPLSPTSKDNLFGLHRAVRRYLAAAGLREVVSQAFMSDLDAKRYGYGDTLIKLTHPPTRNESFVRPDLLPGLINRLTRESLSGQNKLASFEIGHAFTRTAKGHVEADRVAIALLTDDPLTAARQIKGWLAGLPAAVERDLEVSFDRGPTHHLLESTQAVVIGLEPAGLIGVVPTRLTSALKLRGRRQIVAAELDLAPLIAAPMSSAAYLAPSPYPGISRDLTVRFDATMSFASAMRLIEKASPPLAVNLAAFDCHETDKEKSVTYRLIFRANDRTLTDGEVDDALGGFIGSLRRVSLRPQI